MRLHPAARRSIVWRATHPEMTQTEHNRRRVFTLGLWLDEADRERIRHAAEEREIGEEHDADALLPRSMMSRSQSRAIPAIR